MQQGRIPACLKEADHRKNPPGNSWYWIINISLLVKVMEQVVASQFQGFLDERDYLDPFQSGFRPGYGTETALVTLVILTCTENWT